ncbi:MAG: amidohydrolase [Pseudomonadales bacterium]|nr:amidohydrolase [Pseudomonadales bacterium]
MIDVFVARKILTMNPSWPEATAVAVRDGRILGVGSVESLQSWLQHDQWQLREEFRDQVLMPGFIDPHLHPVMAAVLLPMQFIAAMPWQFPWGNVPATTTPADYQQQLRNAALTDQDKPFFTFGYHRIWHGDMSRALLDEIFGARPAVVWQRSFHEVYLNTAMLERLQIDEEKLRGRHQIDIERGHFYENGLGYAINRLNSIIMAPEWIEEGLQRLGRLLQFGGHTTVGDMAVGIFNFNMEWAATQKVFENDQTPFRSICIPHAVRAVEPGTETGVAADRIDRLPEMNTHRFEFGKRIKLFTDGAFFSQLAMLQAPGYIDGHEGEWLIPPENFETLAREYWHRGYRIHVHCTGDLGCELAIDTLEKLQQEKPRFRHGYTIEHFGFSTPEQVYRLKELGGYISANVYYLHELSAAYGDHGIGVDRAAQIGRIGMAFREGVLTTIHSDFPMAPAMPLHNAWVACTRCNIEGEVQAPAECLTLEQALQTITINAARVLGKEDEIGSIRPGKKADFVVLDQCPFEAGIEGLKSIQVLATVFEGQVARL